jgi:hypothetical protein
LGDLLTSGIMGSHQNGAHLYIDSWVVQQANWFFVGLYLSRCGVPMLHGHPKVFEVQDEGQDFVLKFNNNLFGQKQAGRILEPASGQQTHLGWCHSK